MTGDRQFVLYAGCFLVIAVVMLSVNDISDAQFPTPVVDGFGPQALPFTCDFTRVGAEGDDRSALFTLVFDGGSDGPFPHCATLSRGTVLRPAPGGEVICLAHRTATPQDLWEDAAGGILRISGPGGAEYQRRERPFGADAFAATHDIAYRGTCTSDL